MMEYSARPQGDYSSFGHKGGIPANPPILVPIWKDTLYDRILDRKRTWDTQAKSQPVLAFRYKVSIPARIYRQMKGFFGTISVTNIAFEITKDTKIIAFDSDLDTYLRLMAEIGKYEVSCLP